MRIKKTGWTILDGEKEVQFTVKVQWAGLLKGFGSLFERGIIQSQKREKNNLNLFARYNSVSKKRKLGKETISVWLRENCSV